MPEPTFVYDAHDDATSGLEGTPHWQELLVWMRDNRMTPEETRRIEVYEVGGQWFARTLEYTPARRWGRLYDPVAEEIVTHQSTYVLHSPPPEVLAGGHRG